VVLSRIGCQVQPEATQVLALLLSSSDSEELDDELHSWLNRKMSSLSMSMRMVLPCDMVKGNVKVVSLCLA
jgi:hypothetical protein